MTFLANSAPEYAMDKVAEPPPSLAATTSSPPNWIRLYNAFNFSSSMLRPGTWDSRGKIVVPACPPIQVTFSVRGSVPLISATHVLDRVTSKDVIPMILRGSWHPACLNTSAQMGTKEFTGLAMMRITAVGQFLTHAAARFCIIPAFVLKRSSLVIPGRRATPAGMTTTSHPVRAASNSSAPLCPVHLVGVLQWLISTATPGVIGAKS
mmetsp:Transcript_10217/g.18057  ORF Transcript_10217/g.18057 Transcript_10217/m.18057 type:complete len:208 (+) Transcript_10217:647-1270(+)